VPGAAFRSTAATEAPIGRPPMSRRRERKPPPPWSSPTQALRLVVTGTTIPVAERVALVVGTLLTGVNQGTVLASGHGSTATWLRVGVNYLTPFIVASIGFLSGTRVPPEHTDRASLDPE
jgi:hypothetical protein